MKKSIFIALIFSLILTGCAAKKDFTIMADTKWWKMGTKSVGKITAVAPLEEDPKFKLRVEIDLYGPLIGPILYVELYEGVCRQYVKERKWDTMGLAFQLYNPTGDKYQFDMAKVYLTTHFKKYHLSAVDKTGNPIDYSINNLGDYPEGYKPEDGKPIYSFYRYHLPVICEQLDGAFFEISGIYKNGVELPPIQFQPSIFTRDKNINDFLLPVTLPLLILDSWLEE